MKETSVRNSIVRYTTTQRRKNLGSRAGNCSVRPESFCAYNRKACETVPILSKQSRVFQMISNFPDGFNLKISKLVGFIQMSANFLHDFKNSPEFSRWLPIFQTVSKMSEFFQIISHFPDSVTTVRNFPDHVPISRQCQNCPDFSRSFPIYRSVSQPAGVFKIISHFWMV